MKEIILASASPRRLELLKQIGVQFTVVSSDIEENADERQSPEEIVKELAFRKAMDVAKRIAPGPLVIGADTIVVKNGILGKPENEKRAFSMLQTLGGEWHEVVTGVAVIDSLSMVSVKGAEKTRVKMKELTIESINAYIKTGEPMDKAGAYGIQGLGAVLVEKIEGCYFNVVGLPLMKLSTILEEFGVKIL